MSNTKRDVQRLLGIYRAAKLHQYAPLCSYDRVFIDPKEGHVVMYAPTSIGGALRISTKYDVETRGFCARQSTHKELYAALRSGHMNADPSTLGTNLRDVAAARTVANGTMDQFADSLEVARIKIDDALRTKLRNVFGFAAAVSTRGRAQVPSWLSSVLIDLTAQKMVATDGSSLCTVKIDKLEWGVFAAPEAIANHQQFLLSAAFVRLLLSKDVGAVTLSLRESKDHKWAYALSDNTRITERLSKHVYSDYRRVIPRVDGRYEAWVKFVDPHCAELKRYIDHCRDIDRLPLLRLALSLNGQTLWAYEHGGVPHTPLLTFSDVKPVDTPSLTQRLYDDVGLDAKRLLHALQMLSRCVSIFIPVDRMENRLPLHNRWEPWMFTTNDYVVVVAPAKLN